MQLFILGIFHNALPSEAFTSGTVIEGDITEVMSLTGIYTGPEQCQNTEYHNRNLQNNNTPLTTKEYTTPVHMIFYHIAVSSDKCNGDIVRPIYGPSSGRYSNTIKLQLFA